MHLYIELNTGLTENVSSSVVKKLYELASGGTLDTTSDIKGTLHTTIMGAREKAYLEGMFSDFHVTADEYSLTFEDLEFERICVTKWGSDGAVTANLLAAVTNTGWDTFASNTTLTKATDLIYFTGITVKNNCPRLVNCTNLTEITIPPNLHDLDGGFCLGCTNLVTVNGLDHVRSLYGPFTNCPSLTSLVFTGLTGDCTIGEITNSQLTNIEINEGCTFFRCILRNSGGPTTFNVPASVQTFTFTCPNVTTITFALNSQLTTTQNNGGFNGCTNLTTLVNFPWDTWTTMGSYCFASCESLTGTIKTPRGLTNIPGLTINRMKRIDTIIIDSAVTSFGSGNFDFISSNCKVIMNPTTPPTLSSHPTGEWYSGGLGCVFYVPDASYNDYISSGQYWTLLYNKGRIKKQSELPS